MMSVMMIFMVVRMMMLMFLMVVTVLKVILVRTTMKRKILQGTRIIMLTVMTGMLG